MVKPTPSRFNPHLLARDSTQYSVNLPLAQFSRLKEMLLEDTGEMNATFSFTRRKNLVVVSGEIKSSYRLLCQWCLEPMSHAVVENFEFIFAKTEEEAQDMPEGLDPVVLDENGLVHVVDLFEDELILYLPTVARHDQKADCNSSAQLLSVEELEKNSEVALKENEQGNNEQGEVKGGKKNPFDVLKNLDLH